MMLDILIQMCMEEEDEELFNEIVTECKDLATDIEKLRIEILLSGALR